MISLYSGTPGSGKSLDVARLIYYRVRIGKTVVANFPVDTDRIPGKNKGEFVYLDNEELTPAWLIKYSMQKPRKEGEILLIIDEAQILFNTREWGKSDRKTWNTFFTQHRKLGYEIIMVSQFDQMLDKQIRALFEYEYIHRKITNYGWRGWLLAPLLGSFIKVQYWYPVRERVGSECFRFNKRWASIYDTNRMFSDILGGAEPPQTHGEAGGPPSTSPLPLTYVAEQSKPPEDSDLQSTIAEHLLNIALNSEIVSRA